MAAVVRSSVDIEIAATNKTDVDNDAVSTATLLL